MTSLIKPSPRASRPLLFAWYGDDLTGTTDVLEVLAGAGIRAVIILTKPTPELLTRFGGLQAFGMAGASRTWSRGEMDRHLPAVFRALRRSGAPLVQYKICSTFDSSPRVGSIGRAIELAHRSFPAPVVPVVVGAPALGRYVAFGNLFARSGLDSEPTRLDRHPTMTRHPITPMDEADLRVHLRRQTRLPIGLFDLPRLQAADPERELDRLNPKGILFFDAVAEAHLRTIGRLIARCAPARKPLFCVGSSGLTEAMVRHWQDSGVIAPPCEVSPPHQSRERTGLVPVVAISGSCSPVTRRQIRLAVRAGFQALRLTPRQLLNPHTATRTRQRLVARANQFLRAGRSVIIYCTAPSQTSPSRVGRYRLSQKLAGELGELLEAILRQIPVPAANSLRVVVCGGDTSTHAARVLGIEALEYVAPMAPGSPLCRAQAPERAAHAREIVFKGGQVGRDTFFLEVAAGGFPAPGRSR